MGNGQIKPGEVRNPFGRPKKKYVYSDTLREYESKTLEQLEDLDVRNLTAMQRIVRADLIAAMTASDEADRQAASRMIQDRLEGKASQHIEQEVIDDSTKNELLEAFEFGKAKFENEAVPLRGEETT